LLQIGPEIPVGFAAFRALDVHDAPDPDGHVIDRQAPPGLQHHLETLIDEFPHQWNGPFLEQRLASRDLDQGASEGPDFLQDLLDGHLTPFVKREGRVAPDTAKIAAGQTDENARSAGESRFSLNRMEDLIDDELHGTHFTLRGTGNPDGRTRVTTNVTSLTPVRRRLPGRRDRPGVMSRKQLETRELGSERGRGRQDLDD
jgi:hypothetical protein